MSVGLKKVNKGPIILVDNAKVLFPLFLVASGEVSLTFDGHQRSTFLHWWSSEKIHSYIDGQRKRAP